MTEAKRRERAICVFFETLLKLEYPQRRVAVTGAPFSEELPEALAALVDGSGVVDVTIGPHERDVAWTTFRVVVQAELQRRDWLAAGRVLLEKAAEGLDHWRSIRGGAPPPPPQSSKASLAEFLEEAARRANWDAQHGPQHLRTGRFTQSKQGEPEK